MISQVFLVLQTCNVNVFFSGLTVKL